MDEAAQFEFNSDAIGHVLADRRLAVPIYQRSYSWGEDEVEEFWNDLRGAFRDDGETLVCVIAQDRGKAVETPDNNSLMGAYFRRRLQLQSGAKVTLADLQAYGRTDVTFTKVDSDLFFMLF